jgi:hypothetical protein
VGAEGSTPFRGSGPPSVSTSPQLEEQVFISIRELADTLEKTRAPEWSWLFRLAGRLKGVFPGLRSSDKRIVPQLIPYAHEFARIMTARGVSKGETIDWTDEDAVALEFERVWKQRKLPEGTNNFEIALAGSGENPLGLEGNKWVVRLVNLGFLLQQMQPDTPFLIPINEENAEKLKTSIVTLAAALNKAIAERYFLVRRRSQTTGIRRARQLQLNYTHAEIKAALERVKVSPPKERSSEEPQAAPTKRLVVKKT